MNSKKIVIISASVFLPILVFGVILYVQNELNQELSEPSRTVVGELWIITYEYETDLFPVDSLNKELREIYGLRDIQQDPIVEFDTLDKVLKRNSYLKYDDSISENTFGLLIYGNSTSERVQVKELFEEILGVIDAEFHNTWSVELLL